jgi:hypothetical protein
LLTQEYLKKLLTYYPDTGTFVWNESRGNRLAGAMAGNMSHIGYWKIKIDSKQHSAHRLAFLYVNGYYPSNNIDHINRVRSDNRWVNLREATPSENGFNRLLNSNNKSGFKGVHWVARNNRWHAVGILNKKYIHLGSFEEFELAVAARQKFELAHHGEFRGEDWGNTMSDMCDELESLRQQAILRDLEIVRLREALEGIYLSDDQVGAEDAREALSTPIDLSALDRHDEEIVGPWKRDAERYRWLRRQHWNEADLCVVMHPGKAVKLGYDCPSLDRLDAAIDATKGEKK